ncbi:uncharacterized protein [Ptychodera flava]|uniref:uncharacterized protein n=1 Tax=Ptychodera flava TaxID=63121 RepID=UPI00396A5CFC
MQQNLIALVAYRDCLIASSYEAQQEEDGRPSQQVAVEDVGDGAVNIPTQQARISLKFVSTLNCSQVSDLLLRLRDSPVFEDASGSRFEERFQLHDFLLGRASELNCELDREITRLVFPNFEQRTESSLVCKESSIGDGWCDLACNNEEYEYDDGDCCRHSCAAKPRDLPCGINGYECKSQSPGLIAPSWFRNDAQLCYSWYPDGDGGQCGGGAARTLCSGVNGYTDYYRDDTDGRSGGCRMSWAVLAYGAESWFDQVQICYKWYADGDGGQCGGGAASELCAPVNTYTAYYRDDSDERSGGCRMSWQLRAPSDAPDWFDNAKICYEWYADGDAGQCGGGANRILCAYPGQWTSYYRDDTDGRSGGCRMRWGLFL